MKKICINKTKAAKAAAVVGVMTMCMTCTAFAGGTNFESVYEPIVELLHSLLGPLLAIVGAVGTLYCVLLGVKFAKAEEQQDREKAKAHLKNAIIGFALIFVLILALNLSMPILEKWVNAQAGKEIFS